MAIEHAELTRQLAEGYDVKVAKKIGELSGPAQAYKQWNDANQVRVQSHGDRWALTADSP